MVSTFKRKKYIYCVVEKNYFTVIHAPFLKPKSLKVST